MLTWLFPPAALTPALLALGFLVSCSAVPDAPAQDTFATIDAPPPSPVTTAPWQHAMISVSDLDQTARFFRDIGRYETVYRGALGFDELETLNLPEGASAEEMWLRAPGSENAMIRLIDFENVGQQVPTRPGARAWDTGCFWSVMVRAKDMESVYDDAIAMGWWTETPIAPLSFNGSELNIVVFKGPDGVQVQAYERLNRPDPDGYPGYERIGQPFNIMQMTRDRDAARALMVDVLGFDTFWFGAPYVDEEPTLMPLGIPQNLTTSIPYKAGIFSPQTQTLFGRMEYIEIDGLDGFDYAERCKAPNLGILSVSYPVDDPDAAETLIRERGWEIASGPYTIDRKPFGLIRGFTIKAPDGATIEFYKNIDD